MPPVLSTRLRRRLVEDWRRAHRWASVRLAALGALGFGAVSAFPAIAERVLPERMVTIVAALWFALVILGRVTTRPGRSDG